MFLSRAEGVLSEYIYIVLCVTTSSTLILEIKILKSLQNLIFCLFSHFENPIVINSIVFWILLFGEVSIAYHQGLSIEALWISHLQIKTFHKLKNNQDLTFLAKILTFFWFWILTKKIHVPKTLRSELFPIITWAYISGNIFHEFLKIASQYWGNPHNQKN